MDNAATIFTKYNRNRVIEYARALLERYRAGGNPSIHMQAQPATEHFFENSSGNLYCLVVEGKPVSPEFNTTRLSHSPVLLEDYLADALSKGINATNQAHMQPRGRTALVMHVQTFPDSEGNKWVLDVRVKDCSHSRHLIVAGLGINNG